MSKLENLLNDPIFEAVSKHADKINMPAYVIGGYVRDKLLDPNNNPKDIDIVIIGDSLYFAQSFCDYMGLDSSSLNIFKNFGTVMLNFKDLQIEFVSSRKESYRSNSRKPIVELGTFQDDQSRRDFTINALALGLNKENYGNLIDPFNGLNDLKNKIIRTPLDPEITFSDDPLRMLRAIRFSCQLNFSVSDSTLEAIRKVNDRIKIISKERICQELNKIINSNYPSKGFVLLHIVGLLGFIMPEVAALDIIDNYNGKSHKNNFYHSLAVLDNVAIKSDDLWLRWAALLHDIAKPLCKQYNEKTGWTFHGHEVKGAKMVPKIFKNLKLPLNDKMKFVQKMVLLHMRPIALTQAEVTDSAIRRLLLEAGSDIDKLMLLCSADITTANANKQKLYTENFNLVYRKLQEVEGRDRIKNWKSPLNGNEIMNLLQIDHGRQIGALKTSLKEAILEGYITNDKESAIEFVIKEALALGITTKKTG